MPGSAYQGHAHALHGGKRPFTALVFSTLSQLLLYKKKCCHSYIRSLELSSSMTHFCIGCCREMI